MGKLQDFMAELSSSGISPSYPLGQNFLYDPDILSRLAEHCRLEKNSMVLEIGAGFGTLTRALLDTGLPAALTAYEIDRDLEARLHHLETLYPGLSIRFEDAMQTDVRQEVNRLTASAGQSGSSAPDLHVIGNLPYYITTPLMEKLLTELPDAASMCFMVQAEVWPRLRAMPRDGKVYGPLAVLCHTYGQISRVMELPADWFYPKPRVNSIFVRLEKAEGKEFDPLNAGRGGEFLSFLNMLFAQRRKTLGNNLSRSSLPPERRERVLGALSELGHPPTVRAEALNPVELSILFLA